MDQRPQYFRPHLGMEYQYLVDWRSFKSDLYFILYCQRALLMDDDAPTERPDGWSAGRTNENDAMDDVSHAGYVLLHVQ